MTLPQNLTSLSPDAIVELYELDTSGAHKLDGTEIINGEVFCWTPGTIGDTPVRFGGVVYTPMAIYGSGYEWSGQGTVPQPKIQVQNIGGIVSGLAIEFDDLVGATVTRIRTFVKHLDGQSEANPNIMMEPDVFEINRKSMHNKSLIEFELATPFEALNRLVPSSLVMRNTCRHTYRRMLNGSWVYGTCPYAGSKCYDASNNPTTDQTKDICNKRVSGCMMRFGQGKPLYGKFFPGITING